MLLLVKKRTAFGGSERASVTGRTDSSVIPGASRRPGNERLKVFLVNARSIRNKFTDLETLTYVENFDVIAITESWIDTRQRDFLAEYGLPGYSIFSSERNGRAGGGVILYVKDSLYPVLIPKPPIDNIDAVYVQLRNETNDKLTFGLIYRPPAQSINTDNKLYEQLAEVCCVEKTIILGDFNLPVTKWGEPLSSHTGLDLYNNLLESSLYQLVHQPTRVRNILDLVFTTSENLVSNIVVGEEFSSSDHRIVTFDVHFNNNNVSSSTEKIPDYTRADFHKLRRILRDNNWELVNQSTNVHDAWTLLTETLNKSTKECVPMRSRRPIKNSKPKWWNRNIKNCLIAKKLAHQNHNATNNEEDRIAYENLRRNAKRLIKRSKKNLETRVANRSKSNPKEFFSYIRNKKVLTPTIGPLVKANGEYSKDEMEMAKILNAYFVSVFTPDNSHINPPSPSVHGNNDSNISNINISETDVLRAIDKLKINKTPGPDKISPRILKQVKDEISKPLTQIFNMSVSNGAVPQEWKLANVTPIFKKGDKSHPGNYRPISLTSVVCKLLETIIREKIVKHLEENNLIKDTQHGFRSKRSCLTNLLDFFNDVYDMYDKTKAVDIIYLDFQKAFDKVSHKRLLEKLKAYGIKGNLHRWIEDWLTGRKQRVVINGKESDWMNVSSGVPQGSVLGPILFLIYIDDIDEGLHCKISKFADDTKLGNRVDTQEQRSLLQSDLNKLTDWAHKWQMDFNINKCKVLNVGSKNEKFSYMMNDERLDNVNKEKDLGIIISDDLKPSQQCSEAVKKANKLVGFIGRAFEFKSENNILTLYNSLVRPHLEYCVQFWSPYYRKDIEKLERVQRRVTKMIPRLRNKPYEERLAALNLFSLPKRRLRGDLIQVFKIIKGLDNMAVDKYFTIDRSDYTRGNGYKIIRKRFQSNEAKHFFFNRVVNIWNKLPGNVVDCNTIETFKNRLDKYLALNPQLNAFATE